MTLWWDFLFTSQTHWTTVRPLVNRAGPAHTLVVAFCKSCTQSPSSCNSDKIQTVIQSSCQNSWLYNKLWSPLQLGKALVRNTLCNYMWTTTSYMDTRFRVFPWLNRGFPFWILFHSFGLESLSSKVRTHSEDYPTTHNIQHQLLCALISNAGEVTV